MWLSYQNESLNDSNDQHFLTIYEKIHQEQETNLSYLIHEEYVGFAPARLSLPWLTQAESKLSIDLSQWSHQTF